MASNEQNTGNKKMYCILSYIFILWLVGMTQMAEDADVKFHVNQGIVLTLYWVALSIASWILAFIPILGWILIVALWIAGIVFAIMGIMNANKGLQKELPIIGKIKIYK